MSKPARRLPSADELKRQIDPLAVYKAALGCTKEPKGQGWVTWPGLCPFHQHNRPGPFRVNLETGSFHCHACGAHGSSVIDFTMQWYRVEFKEALRMLGEMLNERSRY